MVFKTLISMDKNGSFVLAAYAIAFVILIVTIIFSRFKQKKVIKQIETVQLLNQAKKNAS